ncbi:glyoxylate/hydroxypyruvate reductase HPR3-like [Impatiens glandulifera]|uniref:glyoxylate/hydroxypyruvate reductase HPR3-like n=1 Tax=Impatiens glandulifera TaxID=253017 RepID=UPI001FB0D87E|nr:glyoxylate/hydroxypyruvate reductase HPR3-like [Impatiens glandulifera]
MNTDLPFLILHHSPQNNLDKFIHRFGSRFRLIDPLLPSFSPADANLSRILVCVGLAPVNPSTLDRFPSIQCVIGTSAGVDHIDTGECHRRGIKVTNAGIAFSEDVADYAIGLLIDVLRRISASQRYIRSASWPVKGDYPLGSTLGGKRIGIIGLGSIGSMIATRLESFGCIISYSSRTEKSKTTYTYFKSVDNLARNCDILIACCSLTSETHHIINQETMMLLGKEGIVINVGRGGLVNEKALVEALIKGELGGAGLDVYEEEPVVSRELFKLDNVVLSPHCAVFTPEGMEMMLDVVGTNIEAFLANKPLLSEVKYA